MTPSPAVYCLYCIVYCILFIGNVSGLFSAAGNSMTDAEPIHGASTHPISPPSKCTGVGKCLLCGLLWLSTMIYLSIQLSWCVSTYTQLSAKDLMLSLNETIDQLAISNSVHWYGHVLRRDDDHALRRALDFKVQGQRMKGYVKDMEEAGWGRKCEDWFEKGRCTLPFSVECWHGSDCRWVEVNLTTLTCLGLESLSLYCPCSKI